MKMDVWIPLLSALAGGLIATLGSLVNSIVQARAQRRTTLATLAVQAAVEEKKAFVELVKMKSGGAMPFIYSIPPLAAIIHHESQVLGELQKRGRISPKRWIELQEEYKELMGTTKT